MCIGTGMALPSLPMTILLPIALTVDLQNFQGLFPVLVSHTIPFWPTNTFHYEKSSAKVSFLSRGILLDYISYSESRGSMNMC